MKHVAILVILLLMLTGCSQQTEKDEFISAFNNLSESKIDINDEFQYSENVKALACSFENDTGLMIGTDNDYNVGTIVITADFSKGEAIGSEFGAVMKNVIIAYAGTEEKYKEICSGLGLDGDKAWEEGSLFMYDDVAYDFAVDGFVYSLTIFKGIDQKDI